MAHWQQYNIEERRQLLDIASAEKNLPKLAIEKDWWVTMVLKNSEEMNRIYFFGIYKFDLCYR